MEEDNFFHIRNDYNIFTPRNPNSRYEYQRGNHNLPEREANYEHDFFSDNRPFNDEENIYEMNKNCNSLEYLLTTHQITKSDDAFQEENKKILTLIDFQKKNINNFKEDLIYYFSSPESLKHFKNSLDEEIKYKFYKDLDCENFISAQKERFKLILSKLETNLNTEKKISKFNIFCSISSLIKNDSQIQEKLVNANIIGLKLDESFSLYTQQEIDEDKIITYLNELKDTFINNSIDMESIGLIHFNSIEKNLISILALIENKFIYDKNIKTLNNFCLICIDIFKSFKSIKLFFYIIRLLKQYKNHLDFSQLNK